MAIDLSAAFRKALRMWLPRTGVAVDHFQLSSLTNQAMTETRQDPSQQVKGARPGHRQGLGTQDALAARRRQPQLPGQPLRKTLQTGQGGVDRETARMLGSVIEKFAQCDVVPCRDRGVDTGLCPHKDGGFILILPDGSPSRIKYLRWDNPSLPVHQPKPLSGHPASGEPSCAQFKRLGRSPRHARNC
ncbi:transposase [Arthrobacter sp. MA-N2]|uniref:transposase n=1 Tax=Arthrobacter sp. MA-N2 TaxID=1101188 RepID=UPI0012DE5315|nr:transposase [Arthrobacter sp. MA-N2]